MVVSSEAVGSTGSVKRSIVGGIRGVDYDGAWVIEELNDVASGTAVGCSTLLSRQEPK